MNIRQAVRTNPRRTIVSIAATLVLVGAVGFAHDVASSSPVVASGHSPVVASGRAFPTVVVGLGDSVTAGTNCDCTDFVHLYAAQLPASEGGPALPINLGVAGSTSLNLLDDLEHDETTRVDVSKASIDLVTIGANDLSPLLAKWEDSDCDSTCYNASIHQVGDRINQIVATIRDLRKQASTTILVTNYWNVFADGQVARETSGEDYLHWSDTLTKALNTQICAAATTAKATCVDLYRPFKGDGAKDPTPLLADDGDHPNALGHQLIATALLAASTSPSTSH